MTSVVELEIAVPQDTVAGLFADPENATKWMDDVERYEPMSGVPGTPGSTYRLVPKTGQMVLVATVISRKLPTEVRLNLDASSVTVSVTGTFTPLSPDRTRLVSEEVFSFKRPFDKLFGFVAQRSIRSAHRRHMNAFKRFAEQHA
jgi:hypothetical protein